MKKVYLHHLIKNVCLWAFISICGASCNANTTKYVAKSDLYNSQVLLSETKLIFEIKYTNGTYYKEILDEITYYKETTIVARLHKYMWGEIAFLKDNMLGIYEDIRNTTSTIIWHTKV